MRLPTAGFANYVVSEVIAITQANDEIPPYDEVPLNTARVLPTQYVTYFQ